MVAYGYNIDFISLATLDDSVADNNLETLTFKKVEKKDEKSKYKKCSEFVDVAYENVRNCLKNNDTWLFEVQDSLLFYFELHSNTIEYIEVQEVTDKQIEFWALSTLLPIKLTLEKEYLTLHGGVVAVEDECILFSGMPRSGKSTLVDYFIKNGHQFFTDDIVPLCKKEKQFFVEASYPYCRNSRDIGSLGEKVQNYAHAPKKLKAIYLLEFTGRRRDVKVFKIQEAKKIEAINFEYYTHFEHLKEYRDSIVQEMIQNIPIFKVLVPEKIERINEVRDAILRNCKFYKEEI